MPSTLSNLQSPTANLYLEIREEVIQSRVRTEEEQKKKQVTVEDRRPQPVILEPRTAQPQRDIEDDGFIMFDVSPKEAGTNTFTQP